MKDQLIKLLKAFGLTATRFADEIGVQRSGISHILSGRNQPSFDFITKIVNRYPEIQLEWLILGKGPMLKSDIREVKHVEPDLFTSIEEKTAQEPLNNTPEEPVTSTEDLMITNVTNMEQIVIFYSDGTCKPYLPTARR